MKKNRKSKWKFEHPEIQVKSVPESVHSSMKFFNQLFIMNPINNKLSFFSQIPDKLKKN